MLISSTLIAIDSILFMAVDEDTPMLYHLRMNNLPRWDLKRIYPDLDKFHDDIKKVRKLSLLIEKSCRSALPLKSLIDLNDQAESLIVNITAYAEALLSTDSTNPLFLKIMSEAEAASVRYEKAEDLFTRTIAARKSEFSLPELRDYQLYLSEILTQSEHLMSPAEEALASELSRSGSSAWERLMGSITATAEEGGKTLTQLRLMASDADRSVRAKAYKSELALLKEHSVALASCLNGVKGTVLTLEKRRGWKSPLSRSLFSSRIDEEILDSLLAAMEESLTGFQEYFRTKAKLLGVKKLEWYDLFAPVGKAGRTYSYDEAKGIVISSYSAFSSEMGIFARKAFDSNWLDAAPAKGKTGGAYDIFFPEAKESRVFLNFDGSYDSVSTIAHELGHAYHDSVVKDLPQSLSAYPMTLAETASIFGEMLVFDHVRENADKDEALLVTEAFVQSASQVIVDIYSRFLFERETFEKRKKGELTPEKLSSIMLSAQKKAYGEALGSRHPYMWAVKSHYYSADFSFYNYPYAFGELFALSLYSRKDEAGFAETYRDVLLHTGREDAASCALRAGSDIRKPEFWKDGLDLILSYSERLRSWL